MNLLGGLVDTLIEEYGTIEDNPELVKLVEKWEDWVKEALKCYTIQPLPFYDTQRQYLASQFVDTLYQLEYEPIPDAFVGACELGDMTVAQWLEDVWLVAEWRRDTDDTFFHYWCLALTGACGTGQLSTAKWLLEKINQKKYTLIVPNESQILKAVTNGHLNVLRWLCSIMEADKSMNHSTIDQAFFLACQHGHLEVAKWLYSEFPAINIRYQAYYYPSNVIIGHTANWPASDKRNDDVLIVAYRMGHYHVVEWLTQVMQGKFKSSPKPAC